MDTGQHLTRISAVRIIVKPSALLDMKLRGQQQMGVSGGARYSQAAVRR
jgi:hypothetical protein